MRRGQRAGSPDNGKVESRPTLPLGAWVVSLWRAQAASVEFSPLISRHDLFMGNIDFNIGKLWRGLLT